MARAVVSLGGPGDDIVLERPRDAGHGDWASSVALRLAKPLRNAPRRIAEQLVEALDLPEGLVDKIEIAGPGFINFWLVDTAITSSLPAILAAGADYGRSDAHRGRSINVEFVSANPTGPLHVGHGRGAALGDGIARLLEATGYEVTREFYVNDAGVQIDRLAESLWARVQEAAGRSAEIPEGGYHGAYLVEAASQLLAEEGAAFADLPRDEGLARCRVWGVRAQRDEQDRDLAAFGVTFDVVFTESTLYDEGHIDAALAALEDRGVLYDAEGALWLRTTDFGDTKDRVLRKRDGTYTYFLPDIAYHRTKADRGASCAIDVWGADHHGYIARMRAALAALGHESDFFRVVIVQLVRVMRQGEEVRFSKRSGDFVTLRDLVDETGVDAARYFFLMRRGDSQFVFDIDLALKQSEENPVYYVQYAHTRMAGIFRNASIAPEAVDADGADLALLQEDDELELVKQLAAFPEVVERAAEALEPHRVIAYVEEVARLANGWYHRHRVIGVGAELERARLVLARAIQIVLANALQLLGISAPERM